MSKIRLLEENSVELLYIFISLFYNHNARAQRRL